MENKKGSKYINSHQLISKIAHSILDKHLQEIRNVGEWAALTGCSTRWLGKCLKKQLGKTPSTILKEERYKKIRKVIKSNPNCTALFVAKAVATHWTDKHLYTFLSGFAKTNFTQIRYDVLMGSADNKTHD
jgi:methylphosphotriester-DNA--protein-cysteine methyltransferase